jgi:hypothetical protein
VKEFSKAKKKAEREAAEEFIQAQLQKLRRTTEETVEDH